jgi:hypothetical protein
MLSSSLIYYYFYRRREQQDKEAPTEAAGQRPRKVLGPDHPDVAISLNNLASLYESQGQYAEAEPLQRRSRDFRKGTGRGMPKGGDIPRRLRSSPP